jgi:hypothetical protein
MIEFEGKPCPVCGKKTRRKYATPKNAKGHLQHSRTWVCEKGHPIERKGR